MTSVSLSGPSPRRWRDSRVSAARLVFWCSTVGIALLFIKLSWRRWGDPQIDFGVQLYLPWRILHGEHLVRDYVHPYGPWASYFNAAVFKVLGVSIRSLVITNLITYGLIYCSLFAVFRRSFGFLGAAIALLMSVPLFGFAHLTGINNYNYVSPYSHEATFGILFLTLLLVWVARPTPISAITVARVAGALFGLICLTKIEIVLAGSGLITLTAVRAWIENRAFFGRWIIETLGAALLVIALAWAALAVVIGAHDALVAVGSGFLAPLLYPAYARSETTLRFLGADHPVQNLYVVSVVGLVAVVAIASLALISFGLSRVERYARWIAIPLATLVVFFSLPYVGNTYAKTEPILLSCGAILIAVRVWRRSRACRPPSARDWAQLSLLAVAFLLMARMALAPKVEHYGFYQSMYSTMWVAAFCVAELPICLTRSTGARRFIATTAICWNLGFAFMAGATSFVFYGARTQPIGTGADLIYGYSAELMSKHQIMERTREFLASRLAPTSTLLVLPEGIQMNYLLRAKHPLRITNALPATMAFTNVTADLKRAAPDYVVIMTRPPGDDTYLPFGSDDRSGKAIVDWLKENYEKIMQLGNDPLLDHRQEDFGVWVMARRPSLSAKP